MEGSRGNIREKCRSSRGQDHQIRRYRIALHLAVSDGQVQFVKLLVDTIYNHDGGGGEGEPEDASEQVEEGLGGEGEPEDPSVQDEEGLGPEALTIKNERGNTPLHLAAASGSFEMCYWIAIKHPNLIFIRNNEKMNPLFLAALNGKKDAFLCLDNLSSNKKPLPEYCRGSNGDTFLHAALNGGFFDLSFQIICRYGELVNHYNEKGFTPLHVLATKPSSFKSGKRLGHLDRIIYYGTFVEELKKDDGEKEPKPESQLEKQPKLPENYQACFFIYRLYQKVVHVIHTGNNNTHHKTDVESPGHSHDNFPPNYKSCVEPVELIYKAFLIILGWVRGEVLDRKKEHVWTMQLLNKLLPLSMAYYENNGQKPQDYVGKLPHVNDNIDPGTPAPAQDPRKGNNNNQKNKDEYVYKNETPVLIAAKNGIMEIVEEIMVRFPVAVSDRNSDGKNIVLLAVENRQTDVFQYLRKRYILRDTIFHEVDKDGNSALHLAAKISDRPWLIPGLKMQWEIKWYEFIKKSMPVYFGAQYNKYGQTPNEIFMKTHSDLVQADAQWLMKTSDSCVIAATLIATVAFATSASIPGGVNQDNGVPVLIQQGMFDVFSISSLAALCFSLTALIIFLAILTTQHKAMDFRRKLPGMLLIGLTTLFLSIASMLISFCGGHFFILRGVVRDAWVFEYIVALLPMTVFALVQFPLYFNLFRAALKTAPESSYLEFAIE
ncbi:unnamed protein product [Camellia sinensis]